MHTREVPATRRAEPEVLRLPPTGAEEAPERGKLGFGLVAVGLLASYVALLHYVYQAKVAPLFAYMNLAYRTPDVAAYGLALIMVGLLALTMPYRIRRPSDFALWMLFVVVAIPSLVVPNYADILSVGRTIELNLVVAAIFLLIVLAVRHAPAWTLRITGISPGALCLALIVVSVLTYAYMAATAGLAIRLVGLNQVYDLRSVYVEQIDRSGPLLGYLVRLQGNVINPLLIVWGIARRRWWLLAVGCLGQFPIFSVTGYKLTLLSVPALVGLSLLFGRRRSPRGALVIGGAVVTILLALVADALTGGIVYTQVFANRLFLLPGFLTAAHVLVFGSIDKVAWANSFMSPFLSYKHDLPPDNLVGSVMFNSPETSANANLFGDGYTNLGYSGMLIEALLLIVLLWCVDASARHLPLRVSSVVLFMPVLALANSSVFTSVLSNGFAYAILIMACLPAVGWVEGRSSPPGPAMGGDAAREISGRRLARSAW